MSIHKTTADQGVILSFLKDNFSEDVSNFEVIIGGEGSQAYSFVSKNKEYIIRINKHYTLGFKKDEYAFSHFLSKSVPVPEIYKIGKIDNELRFCISEKITGKIITSFSTKEIEGLLPEMFNVLNAIHEINIDNTKGYGKWDAEGNGECESWREHLLKVSQWVKGTSDKPGLFETTFLEKDFWDKAYSRFTELVEFCPEERFLVHGDYGFNNLLSDGNKITGVIDWEESKYGDFLFDVAWLGFWSQTIDYQKEYLEYSNRKGIQIKNFDERMLCYKIFIGLGSMSFYAYSEQKEKYGKSKNTIDKLLTV